jgi:hypothetical protein
MYRLLKQLLMFRMGQKAARGFAKSIGLRKLSHVIGWIGGVKYARRHA